ELFVKHSSRPGNKGNGNKYRSHYQGNRNDRTRDLIHGRICGRQSTFRPFFHFGMHSFHHHNGIIHHNPNRQYQCEERQQVDRITKQAQEEESTNDRYGNGNSRNQCRSKILKEDKYDNKYKDKRLYQSHYHLVDGG